MLDSLAGLNGQYCVIMYDNNIFYKTGLNRYSIQCLDISNGKGDCKYFLSSGSVVTGV